MLWHVSRLHCPGIFTTSRISHFPLDQSRNHIKLLAVELFGVEYGNRAASCSGVSQFVRKMRLMPAFITLTDTELRVSTIVEHHSNTLVRTVSELDHDALVGAPERDGHQRRNASTPVPTLTSIPSRYIHHASNDAFTLFR